MIKREEFDQRKEAAELARQARLNKKPKKLVSAGKNVEAYPFLQVSSRHTLPSIFSSHGGFTAVVAAMLLAGCCIQ